MAGRTLIDLMETSAERFADEVYLLEKDPTTDTSETTYRETRSQVHRFACGPPGPGCKEGGPDLPHQRGPEPLGHRRTGDLLHRGHQRPHFGEDQRSRRN